MASTKQTADTLAGLSTHALAADPTLRDKTQAIFDNALKRAQYILDFGTDAERSSLIKAIVPSMMRSLQDQEADRTAAAQREAYERMREVMAGRAPAATPPAEEAVVDGD